MNDRLMAMHTSMEPGGKISVSTGSCKEIAGLKKNIMMMMTKIVNLRMSEFSRCELRLRRKSLDIGL